MTDNKTERDDKRIAAAMQVAQKNAPREDKAPEPTSALPETHQARASKELRRALDKQSGARKALEEASAALLKAGPDDVASCAGKVEAAKAEHDAAEHEAKTASTHKDRADTWDRTERLLAVVDKSGTGSLSRHERASLRQEHERLKSCLDAEAGDLHETERGHFAALAEIRSKL